MLKYKIKYILNVFLLVFLFLLSSLSSLKADEVIKEIRIEYAKLILQKKFIPICMDKLYNPENGLMVKKTSKNTMIGKNSAIV